MSRELRAGELRHQIRIERRSSGQNVLGEPNGNWVEHATRRAKFLEVGAGEVFSSEQRQGRIRSTFEVRYLSGVLPSMRLIITNPTPTRLFDILDAVDPDGRRVKLVITALERVEVGP